MTKREFGSAVFSDGFQYFLPFVLTLIVYVTALSYYVSLASPSLFSQGSKIKGLCVFASGAGSSDTGDVGVVVVGRSCSSIKVGKGMCSSTTNGGWGERG